MTKRSLLKIKAKDGFNIPRLPQPNEARKVSRCLQVRLCKQKTKIINYFTKVGISKKYSDQNSPDRFTLFQQIPNSCFDTIYRDMSPSVQMKCLHLWLNIYFRPVK
ncbi:hypothetical protein M0813_06876 [Anaeramoeba flamelloides]|nr:hypothetical protein M0813_06876 [Anaeramoeba flamelloides]